VTQDWPGLDAAELAPLPAQQSLAPLTLEHTVALEAIRLKACAKEHREAVMWTWFSTLLVVILFGYQVPLAHTNEFVTPKYPGAAAIRTTYFFSVGSLHVSPVIGFGLLILIAVSMVRLTWIYNRWLQTEAYNEVQGFLQSGSLTLDAFHPEIGLVDGENSQTLPYAGLYQQLCQAVWQSGGRFSYRTRRQDASRVRAVCDYLLGPATT
jgi:hypothetical protein